VLDSLRKAGLLERVCVFGLILVFGRAFAYSDQPPDSLVGAPPVHEEAISSSDFERFISTTAPQITIHPNPTPPLTPAPIAPPTEAFTGGTPVQAVSPIPGLDPGSRSDPATHSDSIPADSRPLDAALPQSAADPATFVTWWLQRTLVPILTQDPQLAQAFDLEQLIWLSMQYSPRVQSILIVPKIQRTEIDVARGELDPRRFGQSLYHNTSDPVGNTLTTGGPTRLNEEFWENSVGIRDRNVLGGKSELSQALNARDNNSLFFKPNDQIDSKLSLNYTQPLMRGAGRFYNTSSIQLAGLKTQASIATANRELQNHTLDIINTYWDLTLNRYLLAQARNGQDRLRQIKERLEARAGRDLLQIHISKANTAIKVQQRQIAIAQANIRSMEAYLRQLVNAPELDRSVCDEIIPLTVPINQTPEFPLEDELYSAILHRGDIIAIQQTIESAVVQKNVAKNELKPTLDLITNSYVRGLRGDNRLIESWGDQFGKGRPSFAAGVDFQNPVGNRAAKANLLGRTQEISKLLYDYSNALKKARAEIEEVIQSSQGTYFANIANIEAVISNQEEVQLNEAKVEDFFGENQSVSNLLNDLLDVQVRLITAENALATSQINHMLALAKIKYQSGTLMTITAE
jgi:outer membrane protein TolC